MRTSLPGVHKVSKRLAGGQTRTYFYAWRGGPLLKGDDGGLLTPADPRFALAYAEAQKLRRRGPAGTLAGLVTLFRQSSEFTGLKPSTQRDYRRYLAMIETEFGDMPLEAVADPRARGDFKSWRDSLAASPRKADYVWTVLARVLSVAKDRGRIPVNVCERGGRLYEADRADVIWTADDIRKFGEVASEELNFALLLALWTGQRQGDLLRLGWTAYDGAAIRLRQSKTGRRVTIPCGPPLRQALDAARQLPRQATTILVTSRTGLPWTSDGFRASWGKASARAGLGDLNFHDLRGTAVTRLALAGCTVAEIAAITGHSLRDVETILDAHYLGGRVELAETAIVKLSARFAP